MGGLGDNLVDDIVPLVMILDHSVDGAPIRQAAQITVVDEHVDLELAREMGVVIGGLLGVVAIHCVKLQTTLATILYGFVEEFSLADRPENQTVAILAKHLKGVDGEGNLFAYPWVFMGNYCTVEINCY